MPYCFRKGARGGSPGTQVARRDVTKEVEISQDSNYESILGRRKFQSRDVTDKKLYNEEHEAVKGLCVQIQNEDSVSPGAKQKTQDDKVRWAFQFNVNDFVYS